MSRPRDSPVGAVGVQRPHQPPSSGDGMAYHRQRRFPVAASYAVTFPRVANSPPDVPTITRLPTTTGAMVMLYAESGSLLSTSHRTLPLSASRAISRESSVPTKTRPCATAAPRFTGPQHGFATPSVGAYRQSVFLPRRSKALTTP